MNLTPCIPRGPPCSGFWRDQNECYVVVAVPIRRTAVTLSSDDKVLSSSTFAVWLRQLLSERKRGRTQTIFVPLHPFCVDKHRQLTKISAASPCLCMQCLAFFCFVVMKGQNLILNIVCVRPKTFILISSKSRTRRPP